MSDDIDYSMLVTSGGNSGGMTVMGGNTYRGDAYYVTLVLSSFMDARVIEDEDENGDTEMGLFIPLRKNGLKETSLKNVHVTFKAEVSELPSERYTHVLTQILDNEVIEERQRLGYKRAIMGHMRPVGIKGKDRNKKKGYRR